MNKKRTLTILKSVAIVLVIVFVAFLLRANAYNLSVIPQDQKSVFTDSSGLPYFSEMDSYYNLRLIQDYIDHGYFGDTLKDGAPWDLHSYSPEGRSAAYTPLLAYITAFLYNLANMFSDVSFKEVAFWTSAIIAPLAAIPAYIFVRRITNDYGGVSAAVILSLSANYFSHTFAGFFDTDMFNITFPVLIVLFFVESIRNDNWILRIIFSLLTLATVMVFSLAWNGYIFYAALLVIFIIVYLVLGFILKMDLIKPFKDYPNKFSWLINQREIFSVLLIVVVGFIGITLTGNLDTVINEVIGLSGATQLQASLAQVGAYPNVYISVAELQIPNLLAGGLSGAFLSNPSGVINGIGGILVFFAALFILFIFIQRLWSLRSIRPSKSTNAKKPPKGERKAASKLKENKNSKSFIETTMAKFVSMDQVNKSKRETLLYLTLFGVWIALTSLAVSQGSRFILTICIPFGLAAGIFVGYAVTYIKTKVDSDKVLMAIAIISSVLVAFPIIMSVDRSYGIISFLLLCVFTIVAIYGTKNISSNTTIKKTAVMVILTLAIISPSVAGAYQASIQVVPGTSDPMWNSMTWINNNTTKDTVITSWWDFGYLFEIAADRPVTFDGGSQNSPRAFWVGKAMTTTNESLSAGIFKMLGTSGDKAYSTLDNYTNNTGKTVEILEKTLGVPREEAKEIMTSQYKLTSTEADTILKYSHPKSSKPVMFVASSDMLQKAGWWTYFGNWDFDTKNSTPYQYLVSTAPGNLVNLSGGVKQANITNLEEGDIVYKTIITKGSGNNTTNASFVARYANGSKITYPNGTEFVPTLNNVPVTINKLFLVEDTRLVKNETLNKSGDYALFVFGDNVTGNATYSSILMSKELEYSVFTKLFILGGFGQSSFEGVHAENGVSLWKVK